MKVLSVIKNEDTENNIVWKCPEEDFNNNSQLIVGESEQALFYKDGVILQTYTGGKYNLNTGNAFGMNTLRKMFTGGISPFHCRVYFINMVHQMENAWGTETPMQLRDAEFGFAVGVRAYGSYTVQVEDAKKFLIKMVGNNITRFSNDSLKNMFRGAFQSNIKSFLAGIMKKQKMTVLDMAPEMQHFSEQLVVQLAPYFEEYGLRLVNFFIKDISIPEDDPNYQQINDAYAKKGIVNIQGNDWQRIQSMEVMKQVAKNPGGMGGMGAGMGMGFAAAGAFGAMANQAFGAAGAGGQQAGGTVCPKCGAANPAGARFCTQCANPLSANRFCPHCGGQLVPGAKFCPSCGKTV